jgi:hypothetical protein
MKVVWYNIEVVERRNNHYHYMRLIGFNSYGEMVCRFKFKTWK